MLFSELPQQVREYLNDRFALHGIAGEDAFNTSSIFPDEIKKMSPGDIVRFMEKKHISHIYPKSNFPERESDLNNIILEDAAPNMERGAQIMTQGEHEAAKLDLQNDILDGDIDDDGIIDLESALNEADNSDAMLNLIGAALPIGLVMSGIQVVNKVKNKEIILNDAPKEYIYNAGGHSIKVATVGALLASGSPVIVGSTSAILIYKSRKLIENVSRSVYNTLTHDTTKKIASKSGQAVIGTGKIAGKTILHSAKGAHRIATHEKTIKSIKYTTNAFKNASSLSVKIVLGSIKSIYKVATHDKTKKTLKKAGSGLIASSKVGAKAIKSLNSKITKKNG